MATKQSAATINHKIVMNGETIELCVVVRGNHPDFAHQKIDAEQLKIVVARTISNWCHVWQSVRAGECLIVDDPKSGVEAAGVEESGGDPYCTVWNKDWNGLSVTVHSWDNGLDALNTVLGYERGWELFAQYAPRFGVSLATHDKSPSPPPADKSTSGSKSVPASGQTSLRAFVRSTRPGMAPGLLGIEGGKTAKPNWTTQARLMDEPFHLARPVDDPGVIVLYPIAGTLHSMTDEKGSLQIIIDGLNNSKINIKDMGGEHNFEWSELAKKLGFDGSDELRAAAAAGLSGRIDADYIAMKLRERSMHAKYGEQQFKNFYGFYRKPEVE